MSSASGTALAAFRTSVSLEILITKLWISVKQHTLSLKNLSYKAGSRTACAFSFLISSWLEGQYCFLLVRYLSATII
jgi:hypothetical protein